jgi:hypothetical protein
MGRSLLILALAATSSTGAVIREKEVKQQDEVFQRYWGSDFEWKFDELPTKGTVPDFRVPYSGYIYPDFAGGTVSALRKYDRAFHAGRNPATAHEQWDTTAYRKPVEHVSRGLFGRRISRVTMATPHWHGHCNGWAAASMRHAEPKTTVTRNGVAFTPADIKALLAEIYIYNETENLAGFDSYLNAGTFHAIMTNWLGRASHPVAMEADPGEEKWNYPIYAYSISSGRISQRQVEVRMNISYAKDSRGEHQQSPRIKYTKPFHYVLSLDEDGKIVGGQFYRDSSIIDLVWVPVRPKQGGEDGNNRGNPHVDVDAVLAIWRASVPQNVRNQWLVIDPPREDRLANIAAAGKMVPLQEVRTTVVDPAAVPASGTEVEADSPGVETASR